jgi:hypothetical protein
MPPELHTPTTSRPPKLHAPKTSRPQTSRTQHFTHPTPGLYLGALYPWTLSPDLVLGLYPQTLSREPTLAPYPWTLSPGPIPGPMSQAVSLDMYPQTLSLVPIPGTYPYRRTLPCDPIPGPSSLDPIPGPYPRSLAQTLSWDPIPGAYPWTFIWDAIILGIYPGPCPTDPILGLYPWTLPLGFGFLNTSCVLFLCCVFVVGPTMCCCLADSCLGRSIAAQPLQQTARVPCISGQHLQSEILAKNIYNHIWK